MMRPTPRMKHVFLALDDDRIAGYCTMHIM
jgi:hypothetical protein